MEKNGRVMQMHQIVSFDIDSLPQAAAHKYTGSSLEINPLAGI